MENQKTIKIRRTAFFIRLYEFVYSKDAPNGLCPLFWQTIGALVLFPILLLWNIPMIIATAIALVLEKEEENTFDQFMTNWKVNSGFWATICISIVGWVVILMSYTILRGWYSMIFGIEDPRFIQPTMLITTIVVLILLWKAFKRVKKYVSNLMWERNSEKRSLKQQKEFEEFLQLHPNLLDGKTFITKLEKLNYQWDAFKRWKHQQLQNKPDPWYILMWESIKAFYHKNCPRIEWI